MAFRAICLALWLSILPIAGCGTIANLARPGIDGGKLPFGGVKQDVGSIQTGEVGFRTHPKSTSVQPSQAALSLFCAADLPFSFIGDVVTWPYTATYCYINEPVPTPPILQALPTTQAQPVTQPSPTTQTPPATLPPPTTLPPPATLLQPGKQATDKSQSQPSP